MYSGSLYLSGISRGCQKTPSKKVVKKLENSKRFYEIVSTNETRLGILAIAHHTLARRGWTEWTMLDPPDSPIPEGAKCGF